jgi:hypothetical protein
MTAPSTAPSPPVRPSPAQSVVACVGAVPITEATFQHWSTIARSPGESAPSEHHRPSAHELISEVMGFLISAEWVRGEAHDLHVRVSPAKVRRTFNHIRKQQFPRELDFRAFLKQTSQTVADLLMRVELNLLSKRIQRHVLSSHHGAHSQQRALTRFVKHFRTKWEGRTYCSPQYAMQDCGHVQAIS